MVERLTITKLDAAKRQLETVVRLYFRGEDPVSIHTLACAAYNIVRDVNRRAGGPPMLVKDDFIEVSVKTEYQQQVRKKLNEPENFFKHADQDPDGSIEFDPRASEFMIWDAVRGYTKITGQWEPLFTVFSWWFIAANHKILKAEWKERFAGASREAGSIGRVRFFELMLPMAMKTPTIGDLEHR